MPFQTKLVKKEQAAEGTESFYFEKPADFNYKAGQSIDLTIVNPPENDDEGKMRAYSLSSAPFETNLMITTRMRDTAFKRSLKVLPEGSDFTFEGPFGDLTLHNDTAKPAVFLAGGIGVTPFRSIITNATHEHLPHKIFLFYSNRRPEDAAFLAQLQQDAKDNPNLTFVPTMTQMSESKEKWDGEQGYINGEMIKKYVPNLSGPIYYLAGPAAMVAAMRKVLNEAGVNDDYIRTEEFTGY